MINMTQSKRPLKHLALLLIGFLATETLIAQTTPSEIPLLDLIKRSDYLDIKMSPDGKHTASRVRENEVASIYWPSNADAWAYQL